MPDEVIDVWLKTHYERFGWPPTADSEWRYVLNYGRPRNLAYLQSMTWERVDIALKPEMLSPQALTVIHGMVKTHYFGMLTHYSFIGGKDKIARITEYMKEHGTFPKPVILDETPDGYEVLDGNHRITAFLYLYGFLNTPQDDPDVPCLKVTEQQPFWIGRAQPT